MVSRYWYISTNGPTNLCYWCWDRFEPPHKIDGVQINRVEAPYTKRRDLWSTELFAGVDGHMVRPDVFQTIDEMIPAQLVSVSLPLGKHAVRVGVTELRIFTGCHVIDCWHRELSSVRLDHYGPGRHSFLPFAVDGYVIDSSKIPDNIDIFGLGGARGMLVVRKRLLDRLKKTPFRHYGFEPMRSV